ncbi:26S proteasome regulatory subunit 6A-like isoform X2 [Planococcus citri]|uniref:26S proteasome regulatory subunit 6A-like isoform X2 n=1 Tax=Planococcus citri TaxID=170843 RepID=UPI0031F90F8D
MASTSGSKKALEEWDDPEPLIGEEELKMTKDEMIRKIRSLENEVKSMKSEMMRISPVIQALNEKVKENTKKIDTTLPYLVSNVTELSETNPQDTEEGAAVEELYPQGRRATFYDVLSDRHHFVRFLVLLVIYYIVAQILIMSALYFSNNAKFEKYVKSNQRIFDYTLPFHNEILQFFTNYTRTDGG